MARSGGKRTYITTIFVIALLAIILVAFVVSETVKPPTPIQYGVTFSMPYARHLGVDAGAAYLAVLDDLEVKNIRIPVYWSQIESKQGEYDWSEIDWLMDRAAERNAQITLVTGMKVPRWPECHIPDWAETATGDELTTSLLNFMEMTVTRYRNHPALARWQVENEPFFPFGTCPPTDAARVYQELDFVKALDPYHPIVRTTSGEQSIWLTNAPHADVLGFSLYRTVDNPVFGTWIFPIPPAFYALQAATVKPFVRKVIVSELQAEPWLTPVSQELPVANLAELFNVEELQRNAHYAARTGANEIFFWGVEWWYYLKVQGEDGLWDAAKNYF